MRFITLFVFMLSGFVMTAQEYYQKSFVKSAVFTNEEVPAVEYQINKVSKENVMKYWEKQLSGKTKEDVLKDEYKVSAKNVIFESIPNVPYTVSAHVTDLEGGAKIVLSITDSASTIDLESDERRVILMSYLDGFASDVYLNELNSQLKTANQHLKELANEKKQTQKALDKKNKGLIKLRTDIENNVKLIELNRSEYDLVLGDLQTKRTEKTGTSKDDESYKDLKSAVNRLEKSKKNLESEYLKMNNKTYDYEESVKQTEQDIINLEELKERDIEKIEAQKHVVLTIEEEIYKISKP